MCGISGAIALDGEFDGAGVVRNIVVSQHRRGPDANGVEQFDEGVARLWLGHNRLSIIDLSSHANQPLKSSDGRFVIVYNGEIYNYLELREELIALGHSFATQSDSEVLIEAFRAWGVDAINRFYGMFAFALLDRLSKTLTLVRDRFGVKPLYFRLEPKRFVFASTPTVIAQHFGLTPSEDYVARGLRFKYFEDETSAAPYSGLLSLQPGHYLTVPLGNQSLSGEPVRYYNLAERALVAQDRLRNVNADAADSELMSLLLSATQLRLRSDVTVGISVSGGVDSSIVAAIASGIAPSIKGYSFSHPDAPESEGPLVAELARVVPMQPVYIDDNLNSSDLFWRTLEAQGAPFPHASIMAQHAVFAAARADGATVMLGGQGGDEAFMGYRKYFLFHLQSILRHRRLHQLPGMLAMAGPLLPAIAMRAGVFWRERGRYNNNPQGLGPRIAIGSSQAGISPSLGRQATVTDRQILDVTRYSLPSLLRYEDRNSMGNSIESRLPFMDHRILEFGMGLPIHHKLNNGFGKYVLRRAARGRVPASILENRDKRGFDVNQPRWLQSGLADTLRSALHEHRSIVGQFLKAGQGIDNLFSDQAFAEDNRAFAEAVSLIWLARSGAA